MATLTETSVWETGIYQLETTDLVQGGAGGVDNQAPNELANRTRKLYDTLVENGIFIDVLDQIFVGQPSFVDATFEGSVVDGEIVYYNTSNTQFEKAQVTGGIEQNAVGIADVTNSKVITSGLVDTSRSDTAGEILFLSATTAGALTTVDTGVAIARYLYDGVISMSPAAAALAASASIAPGSVGPDKLTESYYTEAEADNRFGRLGFSNTWTGQNDFTDNVTVAGTFGYGGTNLTVTAAQLNTSSVIVASVDATADTYVDLFHTLASTYRYKLFYNLYDFSDDISIYALINGIQNVNLCGGGYAFPEKGDGSTSFNTSNGYLPLGVDNSLGDARSMQGFFDIIPRDTSNAAFSYYGISTYHDEDVGTMNYGWNSYQGHISLVTISMRIQSDSASPSETFTGKVWLERSKLI